MGRVELQPLTRVDTAAILGEAPPERPWADGYPTAGDVEVAGRLRDGTFAYASEGAPFGPWLVLHDDVLVGGAGFHGPPGTDGRVEIGYGIASSQRSRGVATTAVLRLLDLASAHGVTQVVAATDPDNAASQRVLEKCGFRRTLSTDDEVRWLRSLPAGSSA